MRDIRGVVVVVRVIRVVGVIVATKDIETKNRDQSKFSEQYFSFLISN